MPPGAKLTPGLREASPSVTDAPSRIVRSVCRSPSPALEVRRGSMTSRPSLSATVRSTRCDLRATAAKRTRVARRTIRSMHPRKGAHEKTVALDAPAALRWTRASASWKTQHPSGARAFLAIRLDNCRRIRSGDRTVVVRGSESPLHIAASASLYYRGSGLQSHPRSSR